MKQIVTVPNTVLTSPAKTIVKFDKKLHTLLTEMEKTLKATRNPKGVGLAAPQIGEPLRLFITKPTAKSDVRAFINPEIIGLSDHSEIAPSKEDEDKLEGCLSIPHIWGHVKRSPTLTLRFQNEAGEVKEELFEGFMATIIQHETDHTNGILFTHRLMEQKGQLYKTERDSEGKEVLREITI